MAQTLITNEKKPAKKKRTRNTVNTPATQPRLKDQARYYRLLNTLLVTLNGELSQSIRLRRAIQRYNDQLRAGGQPSANIMQAELVNAMSKGEREAAKVAPDIATNALGPAADYNEVVWTRALKSQLGAAFSVRLMERTRVVASREVADYRARNTEIVESWTKQHYMNFQNNWNAAIRRSENTGQPINLMEIARKAIADGQVPPNDKIRNRARLIARDQIGKQHTALDRVRAKKLGASYYEWRSVSDSRVRTEHQLYHGKFFREDGREVDKDGKLKSGGTNTKGEQPGDAVQCRCRAVWKLPI